MPSILFEVQVPFELQVQKIIPIKNTILPKISSKGAGNSFLFKMENKMLCKP